MRYKITESVKLGPRSYTDEIELPASNFEAENIAFAKREATIIIENYTKAKNITVRRKEDWVKNLKNNSLERTYLLGVNGKLESHRFTLTNISMHE